MATLWEMDSGHLIQVKTMEKPSMALITGTLLGVVIW